jgi:hypothetical protein
VRQSAVRESEPSVPGARVAKNINGGQRKNDTGRGSRRKRRAKDHRPGKS